MYKLTCKAMGVECPFEATGETPEEAMLKSKEHAMAEHADVMKKMTDEGMTEEQMTEKMKAAVVQA